MSSETVQQVFAGWASLIFGEFMQPSTRQSSANKICYINKDEVPGFLRQQGLKELPMPVSMSFNFTVSCSCV